MKLRTVTPENATEPLKLQSHPDERTLQVQVAARLR
jgi:hypothetical protein